jgi:hypothetical protein
MAVIESLLSSSEPADRVAVEGVVAMAYSQRMERRSVARMGNVISAAGRGVWEKPAVAGKTAPTARRRL